MNTTPKAILFKDYIKESFETSVPVAADYMAIDEEHLCWSRDEADNPTSVLVTPMLSYAESQNGWIWHTMIVRDEYIGYKSEILKALYWEWDIYNFDWEECEEEFMFAFYLDALKHFGIQDDSIDLDSLLSELCLQAPEHRTTEQRKVIDFFLWFKEVWEDWERASDVRMLDKQIAELQAKRDRIGKGV